MFVQTHQSNLIVYTPKQISLLVPNPNSERKYVDLIEILQMEAPILYLVFLLVKHSEKRMKPNS